MITRSAGNFAAAFAAAALWTTPILAQPAHDDGHSRHPDGHSHAPAEHAENFAAAVREIGERMATLDVLIASGNLEEAHEQSDAIGAIGKVLGALALKPDSGVERAQVKNINKTGKALAEAANGVHDASDKNDAAAAKAAYAEMRKQADALAAFAPAKYFCVMHCEEGKTYDKPGKCPVCNMDLKKLTSDRFSVDIRPTGGAIAAGTPATLLFTIKDPTGLTVKHFEVVHDKLLHLLIVSKDLSWYAHEHPALQPDGTFTLTYTFPHGGEFFLYNDFTPPNVGQQVVIVPVSVQGEATTPTALAVDAEAPKTIDGYAVSLDSGGTIKTGGATHMTYTLSKDGTPVTTLAPYLGAMGHLVIISEDLKNFVHSHPHGGGEHAGEGTGGPKVDFEAHFSVPGTYKSWAQFNVGTREHEQVITVPFTFVVARGDGHETPGPHDHGAGESMNGAHHHE